MEDPFDQMEDAEPVEVPADLLSEEALQGVIADFVLREGTDYGPREFTHEEKVEQVRAALKRDEAAIFFDPRTSTVTLRLRQ